MAGPVVTHAPFTPITPTHHRDERPRPRHPRSATIERRLIRLWKRMTGTVRRNERASILPDGFVLLNAAAARRRSMLMPFAKS
ncbi:hypothetical protein DFH94DRAFT_855455 [Russula ochroleuca]|uniref:Uncharacterized protein n=1 Tax=Russula ochroleuca TaxID=152965 RepID=A0A9P5MRF6_9AGAM|nr:hypothetical protein DFH94DRAFT_855455 [Russula ochroleuca]